MKIYNSILNIMGAELGKPNPLPVFRDLRQDKDLKDGGLLPDEKESFAYQTGFRILPYMMQDNYDRQKKEMTLKTVVIENDKLKATFLIEYGARLYSLYSKKENRELLFSNPVFQPAYLALRNAWFSGGIEWNLGHLGHTYLTCEPYFAAICKDEESNDFLRLYEYERCKRVYFQMDFHLPDGIEQLILHAKIINSHDEAVPLFYWTNIAVPEHPNVRVFSGNSEVIYTDLAYNDEGEMVQAFGHGSMPDVHADSGTKDGSYSLNFNYASEYFYQNNNVLNESWEAASYENGHLFYERSSVNLPYRKLFCWGTHAGGKHWKDFLSVPSEGDYAEIQAGFDKSQVHCSDLDGNSSWEFTQVFGGCSDINIKGEYSHAKDEIYSVLNKQITEVDFMRIDQRCRKLADIKIQQIIHNGSGWGALELLANPDLIPKNMSFPLETLGKEQAPWKYLLEKGEMQEIEVLFTPPSWMVDITWLERLIKAPNYNWTSLLHIGVMLYENGNHEGGMLSLINSINLKKTPIALRTLATLCAQQNKLESACDYMEEAISFGMENLHFGYAEDYIKIFSLAGKYAEAWDFYTKLPLEVKGKDRIQLNIAKAAFETGNYEFLEDIFKKEFTVVKEGETELIAIWHKYMKKKYGDNIPELPYNLDFRMV